MGSTLDSDVPTGTTGTLSVADALRQAADWLDAHPEITVSHVFAPVKADSREDLETLAAAFGDRAVEREVYGERVEIEGTFGEGAGYLAQVRVYGQVKIEKLGGEVPVRPKYAPILKAAELPAELVDSGVKLAGLDAEDDAHA